MGWLFFMQMKPEDFRTDVWKRLTQTLEERLEELRQLNDNPSLGVEQTALVRGGIKELKRILSLAEEASLGPLVDPDELSVNSPGQ
jgi:L-alanine-DL-glutamate epimerase-like enolase superfamily enzyme